MEFRFTRPSFNDDRPGGTARVFSTLLFLACLFFPAVVHAQDAVRPGDFVVEPPTLINLGFHWYISGDDNRDASVRIEYRQTGAAEWKEGLPLLRIGDEEVGRPALHVHYVTPPLWHPVRGSPRLLGLAAPIRDA